MDIPVDSKVIEQLKSLRDFVRAYEPDGMEPKEFDDFGATRKTLKQFLKGYDEMVEKVRSFMIE
ncbi:MAG: hypothetical protein LBQ68_07815 [Clostridiales bacterium]|jgi:transaldolase|nr:hypothetical protein [Clostridiales bacterium]